MSLHHTAGPWMWDSDPIKGDPLGRVRFQVVARGKTIAKTYYSSGDEQALADTVLMASAPDMLKALRRAVLALAFAAESFPSMGDDYEAVSAAIDKAIGREVTPQ